MSRTTASGGGKGPRSIADAFAEAEILSGAPVEEGELAEATVSRREIVAAMNAEYSFVLMGSKAVVMRELSPDDAPAEDALRTLTLDAFQAYLANQGCYVTKYEPKHGKLVPTPEWVKKSALWLSSPDRRTYDGVEFFPDPDNVAGRSRYLNLWRGFTVAPDRKTPAKDRWRKYAIFRDHLENNICAGNKVHFEWLFSWFAWIVQRPRERVGTSVVLRGDQGTGKTVAGHVVGSLFPAHYFLVDDPRYLVGQFNAHMASCLLLQIDEGFWAGDKTAEGKLKGLITSSKQMIEAKGVDPIRVDNRVNVMFSSNESWVVPAGMGERRHAVFDVASTVKENKAYFVELYAELDNGGREALLADLLDYDFARPGAGNPGVIPKTEALLEQKIRSFDPVTSWWYGRLVEGAQTHRAAAWRPHVPTQTLFSDYLRTAERIGIRRRAAETEFGIRMRELVAGLGTRRLTEDVEEQGPDGRPITVRKQVRCYLFPQLHECREHFETLLHQGVAWETAGNDGESAGDPVENAGEEIVDMR